MTQLRKTGKGGQWVVITSASKRREYERAKKRFARELSQRPIKEPK